MNKTLLVSCCIALFAFAAQAQDVKSETPDDGWKKGGNFTLNFSQIALDNWAAGGENSFTGIALFDAFANYSEGNMTWDNTLQIGYGLLKQEDEDWFKSEDKLEFSSKYGQKASEHWYYSGLVDFKTQFSKGYLDSDDVDHSSTFFAPAYLTMALGMDYKPSKNFSLMLAPTSTKFTFVMDDDLSADGAYGVDAGENMRAEFGGVIKAVYKVDIMTNVHYETTLELFSNYLNNPQNIDVNWDNLITFKINKYLNASLSCNFIYDDDIKFDIDEDNDGTVDKQVAQLQFKEMFALGFSYGF